MSGRSNEDWDEKYKRVAVDALSPLLAARGKNGWSWPLGMATSVGFMALDALLEKKKLNCDAMTVLSKMVSKQKKSFDDFLRIATQESKAQNRRLSQAKDKWTFYVPLRCEMSGAIPKPTWLSVLGTRFYFSVRNRLQRDVGTKNMRSLIGRASKSEIHNLPPTWLTFTGLGVNRIHAFNRVAPAFDVLRSCVEITYNWRQTNFSWPQKPRRALPHPEWFIAVSESGDQCPERFEVEVQPSPEKKDLEITQEAFGILKKNARFYRAHPEIKSIHSLLIDCHRLYVQAMDSRFRDAAFLSFWQLAEVITLSERSNGKTEILCKRLRWAAEPFFQGWNLSEKVIQAALTGLANKRNNIVHKGTTGNVTEDDVALLKLICESGMEKLLYIGRKLDTIDELNHFYELKTLDPKQRAAKRKVLKII